MGSTAGTAGATGIGSGLPLSGSIAGTCGIWIGSANGPLPAGEGSPGVLMRTDSTAGTDGMVGPVNFFGSTALAGTSDIGSTSTGGKPAVGKPAVGKPAAGKPAAGKPAVGKPAAGKPAAGKPAAGFAGLGSDQLGMPL